MRSNSRRAPQYTPEQLEALYAERAREQQERMAPPQTPEQVAEREAAAEEEREARKAAPVPPAPTEDAPQRREYVVVGEREVFGRKKGETVHLTLDEGQEQSFVEAGHLLRAEPQEDPPVEPEAEPDDVPEITTAMVADEEEEE